jgi:glycosyltransferase involved in cell wall biosynthesis
MVHIPWARLELERDLMRLRTLPERRVSVFVASINTASSTELCIRSMRRLAGYPFELTVGDCGSTDGSLELLRDLESQGWLRLEVAPGGRAHAEWIDRWRRHCDADLAVFVDSDIEFRAQGWLRDMIAAATLRHAAVVCTEMLPETANFKEPVAGRIVRGASMPAPWLLMIDIRKTVSIPVSFAFHKQETPLPEGLIVWDVGGWFFEQVKAASLNWVVMPDSFRRKFHHYGGLSWIPIAGRRGHKKLRDLQTVERRLRGLYSAAGTAPHHTPTR